MTKRAEHLLFKYKQLLKIKLLLKIKSILQILAKEKEHTDV